MQVSAAAANRERLARPDGRRLERIPPLEVFDTHAVILSDHVERIPLLDAVCDRVGFAVLNGQPLPDPDGIRSQVVPATQIRDANPVPFGDFAEGVATAHAIFRRCRLTGLRTGVVEIELLSRLDAAALNAVPFPDV